MAVDRCLRAVLVMAVALSGAATARAGGFEVGGPPGPVSLGRGGASMARADDPFALWLNPALLADLPGIQATAASNLVLYEPCITRSGTYGDSVDLDTGNPYSDYYRVDRYGRLGDYGGEPFPEVCRSGDLGVSPHLIATFRVHDDVGLGVGVVSPVGSGTNRFGNSDGSVTNDNGAARPSPLRYSLIEQDARLVRLVFGAGVRPVPWLRLGASFVWAMSFSEGATTSVVVPGERPSLDIRSELTGLRDLFVPMLILSAHATPIDELDIALSYFWSDDVRARGDLDLTFGTHAAPEPVDRGTVPSMTHVDGIRLRVPQPMRVSLGLRYADRRAPRDLERPESDPLHDERWDVELDVTWEHTSRIDAFRARVPAGHTILVTEVFDDGMGGLSMETSTPAVREETVVEKGFRDQVTVHLGGDVNLVPDHLAVRGGVSFESGGMDPSLAQPDFLPARRVGVHVGLTGRIGRFDLTAAYAHIFQADLVADPAGSGTDHEAALHQAVTAGEGAIVNAGRYKVRWDLLAIGARYRF